MKLNSNWGKLKQHYERIVCFVQFSLCHLQTTCLITASCACAAVSVTCDQKHLRLHKHHHTFASEGTVRMKSFHSVALGFLLWKVLRVTWSVQMTQWNVWNHQEDLWFLRRSAPVWLQELRSSERWGAITASWTFRHDSGLSRHVFKQRLWPACSLCDPLWFMFCKISWEHAEEPSAPALVPVAPQFLGHVCGFFFLLHMPRSSSRRGPWAAGPLSVLVGPSVSWFLNPWNLSSSSTGTRGESLWASLRPPPYLTCISACVYLLSHGEHLGLNAVQWLSLSTMTKTYILW